MSSLLSVVESFCAELQWVWPAVLGAEGTNRHVDLRHSFEIAGASTPIELHITADARYAVWLNGILIGTGPFADWPGKRSIDTWNLTAHLRMGENVLAITVQQIGVDTASYVAAKPGVAYGVRSANRWLISSGDPKAMWRPSPAYVSGVLPRLTLQLPFTFDYDAKRDDGWRKPSFDPQGEWIACVPADGTACNTIDRTFRDRPVPAPLVGERIAGNMIAQGVLQLAKPAASVAMRMQQDWLSARTTAELFQDITAAPVPLGGGALSFRAETIRDVDGAYLLVDLGRESVGYFEIECESNEGVVIDCAFGEHVDDLRVRAAVGGRNFAFTYRTKTGRQSFLYPFLRLGARYLQLHISGLRGAFTLHYVGLRDVSPQIQQNGHFESADRLQNRIHAVAVETLRLCIGDHYEDCPWREQGLYAMDMFSQSLSGYYAFGDYRMPQVSLELLSDGCAEDGTLELCAPSRVPITIPSFTMGWILAIWRNLLFSGDQAFARSMFPRVKSVLVLWLGRVTNGLIPSLRGPRYWHFYDWTESGLDGTVDGDCQQFASLNQDRFDAALNAFFILGLDAGATLAEALGEADTARQWRAHIASLRGRFHDVFWDTSANLYRSFAGQNLTPRPAAELIQALALFADCCPEPLAGPLRKRLLTPPADWVRTSLGQTIFRFEALLQDPAMLPEVMKQIAHIWGDMLFQGATSFWETLKGSRDFDGAGSLCHGWSATPAYFYGAYLLGIRPIETGYRTFEIIAPRGVTLDGLNGIVPTPHGPIQVRWNRETGGLAAVQLTHPAGTRYRCGEDVRVIP